MSLQQKMRMAVINSGKNQAQLARELNTSTMNISNRINRCRNVKLLCETLEAIDCDLIIRSRNNGNINFTLTVEDIEEDEQKNS